MGKFWFEIMQPTFGEANIELIYTGKAIESICIQNELRFICFRH